MELAEQLMEDIDNFKAQNNLTRVVTVWCGSTEIYMKAEATHATLDSFEKAMRENDPSIAPSMVYAYAALRALISWKPARFRRISSITPTICMRPGCT